MLFAPNRIHFRRTCSGDERRGSNRQPDGKGELRSRERGSGKSGLKRGGQRRDGTGAAQPAAAAVPRPSTQASPPRGAATGARAIASLVPGITRKSFEKHGFAAASLIMDWAQIVGAELARDTRPLKLKWPRQVGKYEETAADDVGRPGATLMLQVDPAAALEVQYRSAQLMDRINAYFGYRAVTRVTLMQEAIPTAPASTNAATSFPRPQDPGDGPTEPSANDPLAAALQRLGSHIGGNAPQRKERR